MVQQLGGPEAAYEAVQPQLNAALEAVGLQGYASVGTLDANKVLKKKRAKTSKPSTKAATPPSAKGLPAAPPSSKPKPPPPKPPPKPPPAPEMALTAVKVKGHKRGLHRKVGGFAVDFLTNIKNSVVKRK